MHRRLFILVLTAWLIVSEGVCQDPQFSQFYSNPLYLAPSFAGAAGGSRICMNARDQWLALPSTFMTYSFSYDHYFSKFNSGFGILGYKDAAGSGQLGTLSLGVQYSYNFKITQTIYGRPGLYFSYRETGVAWDKLVFIDEISHDYPDPTIPPASLHKTRDVDLALSTLIYSNRVWGGFTVDHLLMPNVSLYADKSRVPIKTSIFGGVELVRKSRLLKPDEETMTLAFLFKKQGPYTQLDLGVYWFKNPFVLGLWYRGIPPFNSQRGDAFIILGGYRTRNFNLGLSYDVTVSNLIGHAVGSLEASLSLKFALPRKNKKGEVPCPEF
ncbi:MAG TPA: PorP/SprF family type IX secretion system membrane protein [Bacteroidales bacterium]|nr:PorP/SprF family type IX secretion system membrane protein [Bacteroidales bacterium]